MGWLGWSEQETLDADVNSILVAYEGRQEMLAWFAGGEKEPADDELPEFMPGIVRGFRAR